MTIFQTLNYLKSKKRFINFTNNLWLRSPSSLQKMMMTEKAEIFIRFVQGLPAILSSLPPWHVMCQLEVGQLLHCPEIILLPSPRHQAAAVSCDELVKIENNLHLVAGYYFPQGNCTKDLCNDYFFSDCKYLRCQLWYIIIIDKLLQAPATADQELYWRLPSTPITVEQL